MKNVICIVLLVSLISTLPVALAGKGNLENGKKLFAQKCATCHGASGEGKAAIARLYKVTMLPLGSKEVQSGSDEELGKVISNGKGKMKAVSLKAEEVSDVIAYMRSLAEK